MKMPWYDGSVEIVKQNRFMQSFRDFLLKPYQRKEIDDLDDVLEDMDELFEDKNMEYTNEVEQYLKTQSKQTLDSLKGESLKSLLKDIEMGKLEDRLLIDDLPDDYNLEDVKNEPKTQQLITPFEERAEKEYTVKDLGNRLRANMRDKDAKKFITFPRDLQGQEDKIIFEVNLPSETPEEEYGKIGWYKSQNIEVALHKKTETRAPTETVPRVIEFDEETRQRIMDANTYLALEKKPDGKPYNQINFERDVLEAITDDYSNLEKYILLSIPAKMLDKNHLYDLRAKIELSLKPLPDKKKFEIDERATIDDEPNPNYGKFLLDEEGKKIPLYDADEIDNLKEIKITSKATPTRSLKPKLTGAATQGTTERISGLGRSKMTAGRAGSFSPDKINMARKYYFSKVKANLRILEQAIRDIPNASVEA